MIQLETSLPATRLLILFYFSWFVRGTYIYLCTLTFFFITNFSFRFFTFLFIYIVCPCPWRREHQKNH